MKKVLATVSAALLAIGIFATRGAAAGFRLPDQDAAAMGMAGAFVGQADNPSAVWYNPAGITGLDGTRISAGATAIFPAMQHANADGTTDVSEREIHVPAELFFTSRINEQFTWGLGLTSPFGLSTNWSEKSETSGVATFSRVKSIDLNPNIAYKMSDRLSVAVGIDYILLQATMEKMLAPSVLFRLDGEGSGWGGNAGVLYKAGDQVDVGFSYRSRVKIKVDDATADVNALGLSNPVQTEITLPDLIQAGISLAASDKLTLNADLDYTWWSTYDRLIIKSKTIALLPGSTSDVSIDEKNWKNTFAFRIGAQYKLSDQWKLRAGYVYDQNPVPSNRFETRVPDSDRHGITVGTGYTCSNITVDASYMYLLFNKRTINDSIGGQPDGSAPVTSLNGTYKTMAHLAAVTIGYKF